MRKNTSSTGKRKNTETENHHPPDNKSVPIESLFHSFQNHPLPVIVSEYTHVLFANTAFLEAFDLSTADQLTETDLSTLLTENDSVRLVSLFQDAYAGAAERQETRIDLLWNREGKRSFQVTVSFLTGDSAETGVYLLIFSPRTSTSPQPLQQPTTGSMQAAVYDQLKRELRVNTAIASISRQIMKRNSIFDLQLAVADSAVDLIHCATCWTGYLNIYDNHLYLVKCPLKSDVVQAKDIYEKHSIKKLKGFWKKLIGRTTPLMSNDPSEFSTELSPPQFVHSIIAIPIHQMDHNIGFLVLVNSRDRFTHSDMQVSIRLADLLSIAIRNEETLNALRKSEERFELAATSALTGLWDWPDVTAEELWWSPRCYEMLEIEPDTRATFQGFTRMIHPEDQAEVIRRINRYINRETVSDNGPELILDFRILKGSDSYLWIRFSAKAIWNDDDIAVRMSGAMQDITSQKQLESALMQSDRDKEIILNNLNELVLYLNMNMEIIWANRATTEALDQSITSILGQKCYKLWHYREEPCDNCPVYKALETGMPHEGEIETPDGRLWSLRSKPALDEDGEVVGVIEIAVDVTQKKANEIALKKSEERFEKIVEQMPVLLDAIDEEGNIVLWNRECERVTGYAREEILHNPDAWKLLYPSEKYRMKMLEDAEKSKHQYRNIEYAIQCKDGSKKIISWSSLSEEVPIPGWKSWDVGVDITQRKVAEKKLKEREELLSGILRVAPVGICLIEKNRITWTNQKLIHDMGYSEAELKKLDPEKVFHSPDTPDSWWKQVMDGVESDVFLNFSMVVKCKDGHTYPAYFDAAGIRKRGKVYSIVATIQDLTELRAAEDQIKKHQEQLAHAQKMEAIGRIAGGIAHDFNNLLTAIIGNANMIDLQISRTDPLLHFTKEIHETADRGAELVKQLMAFSSRQVISPRVVNYNEIITSFHRMLRRIVREDISLKLDLYEELPNVLADTTQLEQVVLNLVVNAGEAIEDAGKIIVRTFVEKLEQEIRTKDFRLAQGNYVVLEISDTGCGMPEDVIKQAFDPFYSTKKGRGGTGMGLSTVYGIVKQYDGAIIIDSTVGKGTTFDIYFPVRDEEITLAEEPERAFSAYEGNGVILIVEDDPAVRKIAERALKQFGYEVYSAQNGSEALSYCKRLKQPVDLVLTDVVMPEMNGTELEKQLLKVWPDVKVLFMSGYTEDLIEHHGQFEPGVNFIQKPFSARKLADMIGLILSRN